MHFFRFIGGLFLFILVSPLASANNIQELQQQAQQKSLAAHATWIALVHYRHTPEAGVIENTSYVDDVKFFLAVDGSTNPNAELVATIENVLFEDGQTDEQKNNHPRCRFPARYEWLAEQLNFKLSTFGNATCPEYKEWRDQVQGEKVTLVYAASYLNSPSSMYGHTLLRLDPLDMENHSDWLSWGVNFGADIPPGDGSLIYAYKGIFGGYPGKFNVLAYLEKIKDYNKVENRDLWEYELNLTPAETKKLVTHLWELKDIRFDYFFFDENCSYRLLELLEFARPGTELTDNFGLFAIPADTVRSVRDAGFISHAKRRPSKANIIVHQMNELSEQELNQTRNLVKQPKAHLGGKSFAALAEESQARVIDTSLDFLNYKYRKSNRKNADVKGRFGLLQKISQLPTAQFSEIETPVAPEDGHESSLFAVGAGRIEESAFVDLTLRASFHDLTDNLLGYDRGAAINMGSIALRYTEEDERLRLQHLGIIDIHSFSPRDELFKPISWEVELSGETRISSGDIRFVPQLNASGGVSYNLWSDNITYALAGGRIEVNHQLFNHDTGVAGQLTIGSLIYSRIGTMQIEWQRQFFTNGYDRSDITFLQNISLGKDQAIRLHYNRGDYSDVEFDEYGIAWRQYF